MKTSEIKNNEGILRSLLHRSLVDSANWVVDKCHLVGSLPQVPDFIMALALEFTPNLYHVLKAVFPGTPFSVTGIYCHQKPLVDIGLRKAPHLGDLLLVYLYTDASGAKTGNSLLLQAKKSSKASFTVPSTEDHQLRLYREWPEFSYRKAGKSLNGTTRDILPKALHGGAQYLLIDDNPFSGLSGLAGTYPMGCALPARELCAGSDLAAELTDFLRFKTGRTFEPDPRSSRDDWTRMIWELLGIAEGNAYSRNTARLKGFPQEVTRLFDGCCYFVPEARSILAPLHEKLASGAPADSSGDLYDGSGAAPSLILIESFAPGVGRKGK